MLNDSRETPEGDFEMAPEPDAQSAERTCVRFRASLWLGIAADIRRRRAAQQTKEMVSC